MATSAVPKYLKDIEIKLKEKLKLLKKPNNDLFETKQLYYDSVLEIYQEAFINLIQNTMTYSPFLNEVRNAYDKGIQIRDQRISHFIAQDKLFGISVNKKQRDNKMKALLKEIDELKEKNLKLTFDITKLKKDMGKMKDDQFSEYLCLMRERDARYTLYFENLGLQLKLKELDGSSYAVDDAYGDPVVLRIALDRCREQLSSVQGEMKKVREEYSDSVPRREFDTLEASHGELTAQLAAARDELRSLHDHYDKLLAKKKSIEEELFEMKERCRELERAGTPRPHWDVCADFIGGGRDRWCQLARGLSSRETLRVLLKELGPAADSDHLDYFHGLGTGASVPAYLRWSGRVRNLRLSRRELCVLVNDIWRGREHCQDLPMHVYLDNYFQQRYGQPSMRAEWAYNLCASAEQALDEPAVGILWGALHGVHSEQRYWALRAQWHALRHALAHAARGGETVTMEELEKVCKATFPLKSEVDIRSLCEVARRQLKMRGNATELSLDKLFHESEEGFLSSEVARELHRQRGAAQARYVRELLAELGGGGRRARQRLVSVDALKRALAIVDPAIDHIRMERYVRSALGGGGGAGAGAGSEEPLAALAGAPLHAVAARLAAADVERAGPRYRHRTKHSTYK